MKKLVISVLLLALMFCSLACGESGSKSDTLQIKVTYNLGQDFGISRNPEVSAGRDFSETLQVVDCVVGEDGSYTYTYEWGEIKPTDKVYIKSPVAVVAKDESDAVIEIAEGATALTAKGGEWFTLEDVYYSEPSVGFDGLINVSFNAILVHNNFPAKWGVVANSTYYKGDSVSTVTIMNEFGQPSERPETFRVSAFDALIGNVLLVTGPKEDFEILKDVAMEIAADVEVEVVNK